METIPINPTESIPFTTITQGEQGGPKTAKEQVLRSEEDFTAFFDETPPDSPDINWEEEVIVGVALGERPTGGYSVEITDIVLHTIGIRGGTVDVSYTERTPSNGAPDVLTYPYHAVKCPRFGMVHFIHNTTDDNQGQAGSDYAS